jgi:hypothetical protein
MEKALKGTRAARILNKHMALATSRNGLFAIKAIRNAIKKGDLASNSALTADIKGSNKPLVDRGDLFGAIAKKQMGARAVFAGVLQEHDSYSIAETLHEGRVIRVTPAMRTLFRVLWMASEGTLSPSKLTGRAADLWKRMPGGWVPLSKSTVAITIPSRPFIREAFENPELKDKVIASWQRAIVTALREMVRGG